MSGHRAHGPAEWDARFATEQTERWAVPSQQVTGLLERALGRRPPGRAVELGCGPGRHAIWLAERGWSVVGVDFSSVAIGLARRTAEARGVDVDWRVADVITWAPPGPVELVLAAFISLPEVVLGNVMTWLVPGGQFVAVVHSTRNAVEGEAGPRDPALLYTPDRIRAALGDAVVIDQLDEVEDRTTDGRRTILLRLVAHRERSADCFMSRCAMRSAEG